MSKISGPWKVVHEPKVKYDCETGAKKEFDFFWVRDESEESITLFSNEYSSRRAKEKAHLVSAAPEMFEALELAIDQLKQIPDEGNIDLKFAYKQCREALAKARGANE